MKTEKKSPGATTGGSLPESFNRMNDETLINIRLWLSTKASADRERADAIAPREPFLARLLREDAAQADALLSSLPQE